MKIKNRLMACLYIANGCVEFLWDVIYPGINMYLPAITSRELLIGGVSKFLWDNFWLHTDFALILGVSSFIFIILTMFGCRLTIYPMFKTSQKIGIIGLIYAGHGIYALSYLVLQSAIIYRVYAAVHGGHLCVLNF